MIDMIVGAAMYRMLIDPDTPATTRQHLRAVLRQADRLLRPLLDRKKDRRPRGATGTSRAGEGARTGQVT